MTEQEVHKDQIYWEVDIEYTTGAKMVLLGEDEDAITHLLGTQFSDIPNLKILSIKEADQELVQEAKARRAFEEQAQTTNKKALN